MDVAISGSSGLIGGALMAALAEAGHRPIRLVRRRPTSGADEILFMPSKGEMDRDSLEGVGAVVNLAGAGIGDRRWSDDYRRLLVESRVGSTDLLATTMAKLDRPPAVFLSGSAIGYYGDDGNTTKTESSPPADDFLAQLCVDWEAAAQPAIDAGIRTALLRTGIVLSNNGGALGKLLPLFKLGVGGRFGSGRQYMSWITIEDVTGAIVHLLDHDVSGPVNLTAPTPVTNATFTKSLGTVLRRPSFLPVPAFGPKLVLGSDRAQALLFDSIRVLPKVLVESGYRFVADELESGLRLVLDR